MKVLLCWLLVGIVAVNSVPQFVGHVAGRRGGGKRSPCGGKDNIVNCACEDGEIYDNVKDLKENCPRSENPIESCECLDRTTWEPLPSGPCGNKHNVEDCTCKDGVTYNDVEDVKENCRRGEIESCNCSDGSTWKAKHFG